MSDSEDGSDGFQVMSDGSGSDFDDFAPKKAAGKGKAAAGAVKEKVSEHC